MYVYILDSQWLYFRFVFFLILSLSLSLSCHCICVVVQLRSRYVRVVMVIEFHFKNKLYQNPSNGLHDDRATVCVAVSVCVREIYAYLCASTLTNCKQKALSK